MRVTPKEPSEKGKTAGARSGRYIVELIRGGIRISGPPNQGETWTFSDDARQNLRAWIKFEASSAVADLERTLAQPFFDDPRDQMVRTHRYLERQYQELVRNLRSLSRILEQDDLFGKRQSPGIRRSIGSILSKGERHLKYLQVHRPGRSLKLPPALTKVDLLRSLESERKNGIAGAVLHFLEAAGVPTGGSRAADVLGLVMEERTGLVLEDSKRSMHRYRKWWKGLAANQRAFVLRGVSLPGIPTKTE